MVCYSADMEPVQRKHVSLDPATVRFLEEYQRVNRLASFSAAVEAAAESLRESSLAAAYQRYEAFYAQDAHERQEAEAWLALPMDES